MGGGGGGEGVKKEGGWETGGRWEGSRGRECGKVKGEVKLQTD